MSKAEQAVNDLIEKWDRLLFNDNVYDSTIIEASLQDNQNTIDALEAIPDLKVVGNILLDIIEHYQAVQTILKSKLK
tara:strand:+ start:1334 stop:1564 length:231 start_codon:yes stop_codon:yes gene_type:complete